MANITKKQMQEDIALSVRTKLNKVSQEVNALYGSIDLDAFLYYLYVARGDKLTIEGEGKLAIINGWLDTIEKNVLKSHGFCYDKDLKSWCNITSRTSEEARILSEAEYAEYQALLAKSIGGDKLTKK